MANITPGQARVGWGVFLAANGELTKPDLQTEVDQLGVGVISDRMYRHYRSLFRTGYDHYIPINRFDILQAAEPFGNESANSRYRYSDLGQTVRVVAVRDQPFTFLAIAKRASDAGLTLQIDDKAVADTLIKGPLRLRAGEYLRVDFLEGSKPSADGRLLDRPEKHPQEDSWLLEIEFSRIRSVVEFTDGSPMATDICPVRLDASDGGPVAADVLGRRLYHLLDAVENTRSLFNEVAQNEAPGFSDRIYPARISHVEMDSPLHVTLLIPVGVVTVLGVVWSLIKGAPVAYKTVQDGRLSGAQARKERALADSAEMDNEVKRVLVQRFVRQQLGASGAELDDPGPTSRLFNHTLDQLMENLDGMEREAVTGLELPSGAEPDLPEAEDPQPPEAPMPSEG